MIIVLHLLLTSIVLSNFPIVIKRQSLNLGYTSTTTMLEYSYLALKIAKTTSNTNNNLSNYWS